MLKRPGIHEDTILLIKTLLWLLVIGFCCSQPGSFQQAQLISVHFYSMNKATQSFSLLSTTYDFGQTRCMSGKWWSLLNHLMMNRHDWVRSGRTWTWVSRTWLSSEVNSINASQLQDSEINPELGRVSVWFCFQGFFLSSGKRLILSVCVILHPLYLKP